MSRQAIEALIVFLVAVSAFIAIRFRDWRMAAAALAALFHDLILTAGVYSIIGFTVTPSTVVGLLTILGFSLYDTVVVFDKVDENSRGILAASRYTYAEAANNAVNQTIMRSINTSIIGLLPVAGLLFVGAGILGVGTLEDLALVLFVGMLTGAYSSLFLATPWLVDLKMLDPRYKNHAARILSRRARRRRPRAATARRVRRPGVSACVRRPKTTPAEVPSVDDEAYARAVTPRVGAKPAARSGCHEQRQAVGCPPVREPSRRRREAPLDQFASQTSASVAVRHTGGRLASARLMEDQCQDHLSGTDADEADSRNWSRRTWRTCRTFRSPASSSRT